MKKVLSLLTLILILLLMTGCGSSLGELIKLEDTSDVTENVEATIPSVSVEPLEEVELVDPYTIDAKNQYILGSGIFTLPQIPETLIYHSETCKIYAKNIEYDTERCRIAFSLENKGNETIRVDHLYLSINDWMITNITNSADVIYFQPDTATEFHVSFALDELKIRHIDAINEFIVTFEVEEEMTQLIVLRTNENEQNTPYKPEGNLIYEDNDMKAIVPKDGCVYDGKLYLYVENNSNETIYFDCSASSTKNKDDSGLTECQAIILPFSKEMVPVSLWDYKIKSTDTIKIECYSVIYDLDNHIFSDSELKYGDQYTINIIT